MKLHRPAKLKTSVRWNKLPKKQALSIRTRSNPDRQDGEVDSQLTLMHSMKAMIGVVEQPLVAVSIDRKVGAAKLLCATNGAQKLLFSADGEVRNGACVDAFLVHCVRLENGAEHAARWNAPNGETYRLVSNVDASGLLDVTLIQIVAEQERLAEDLPKLASEKGLTPSETKVFALMARGLGNKEIARDLKSSVHTVRAHLRNIFKTLKVRIAWVGGVKCGSQGLGYLVLDFGF